MNVSCGTYPQSMKTAHRELKKENGKYIDEGFIKGLEWKDGIGALPGSDMKFFINKKGDVELMTEPVDRTNFQPLQNSESEEKKKKDAVAKKTKINTMKGTKESRRILSEKDNGVVCKQDGLDDPLHDVTTDIVEVLQVTCPICQFRGEKSSFRGRFCSRKCLAKNANMHRNSVVNVSKDFRQNKINENGQFEMKSNGGNLKRGLTRNKDELKLRIRLSSSPRNDTDTKHTSKFDSKCSNKEASFDWDKYLSDEDAIAAPLKAFRDVAGRNPFPAANNFKCGMAMEGVDPKHQSLICPLSVKAVLGNRMRLNFCGYCESFDFWVNADSPFVFPCGFCEKTGRTLQTPKGYSPSNAFNWKSYLTKMKLIPAPSELFSDYREMDGTRAMKGKKLEAVDKHNPELLCVATVHDVIGTNILVHFDGWTHDYDYWCSISSPLIHQVGWCEREGQTLTRPEGYNDSDFSWDKYLKETNSNKVTVLPSPKRHNFEPGMKLEAVDPRNPILIRVATIVKIKSSALMIHFDGWKEIFDFWTDVESPDIHPPGWCKKTRYPLKSPVKPEDLTNGVGQGGCPIPGCNGIGHIKGSKYSGHHSEFGCPYSPRNLQGVSLNDRLSVRSRLSASSKLNDLDECSKMNFNDVDDVEDVPPKRRRRGRNSLYSLDPLENEEDHSIDTQGRKKVVSSTEIDSVVDEKGGTRYSALHHSVFLSALSSFPNYDLPLCWDQHARLLPSVRGITVGEVSKWSVDDVVNFITKITGKEGYGRSFNNEEIDGEAMLMLKQNDISKVMNIKLGPAVKISNAILLIKSSEHLSMFT